MRNPLRRSNGRYEMDFDGLERCAATARLLLLCSPHNPVGRVWSESELKRILQIAEKHDLVIFSDDIHADLVYHGSRHHMLADLAHDSTRIVTAVAPQQDVQYSGVESFCAYRARQDMPGSAYPCF